MFCMVFSLLSGARDHPFDKTRQKPVGRRLHGGAMGPAGNPRGAGVERAGRFASNTARTGAGLRAGDRTGLGDCQSKRRCLNQATGGEEPKQTSSANLIRKCQAKENGPGKGERIIAPTHAPCATATSRRDTCRARQRYAHRSEPGALLQPAPMSIAELL